MGWLTAAAALNLQLKNADTLSVVLPVAFEACGATALLPQLLTAWLMWLLSAARQHGNKQRLPTCT
jgi:hypothetical protein